METRKVDEILICAEEPVVEGRSDRKEDRDRRHDDFRGEAEPQPEDEEWRDGEDGDRLTHHHDRQKETPGRWEVAHDKSEEDTEHASDDEAEDGLDQRRRRMDLPEFRPFAERRKDERRPGQHEGRRIENEDDPLPDDDEPCRHEQRAERDHGAASLFSVRRPRMRLSRSLLRSGFMGDLAEKVPVPSPV